MALPAPRTWSDGEDATSIPTADDLNLDWRDSFDFLLGYSRPMIYLHQSTSQALTAGVFTAMNWQVELLKRGGMTHAASGSTVTVPYTGQYVGFCQASFGAFSTDGTRVVVVGMINGVQSMRFDMGVIPGGSLVGLQINGSITANMTAGDTFEIQVRNQVGTVSTSIDQLNRSRLALWYAGDAT